MRTTLSQITQHYSTIIKDISFCLSHIEEGMPKAEIFVTHYLLLIKHHAENALTEIDNLPKQKE